MNVIFGASGHAKEIEYLLRQAHYNHQQPVDYFVSEKEGKVKAIPVISENTFEALLQNSSLVSACIAIGNGLIRKKIVDKFKAYSQVEYPNVISTQLNADLEWIKLGTGNVFFPAVLLTTEIEIGDHNHFNLQTSISHEGIIGNYNTFSPATTIAGNVTIGNHNFFGVGARVIDNVTIGDHIIIGAGAVVTRDISEPGTYVGVPAKKIK
jgi:sugar O-acyltransferase (sialic acid O-acetyltransferase NeuD family)